MSFVNLSLAFGGVLISVPILLHLLLRQKPKQLMFPAIRFIQQRKETNKRTLQLRHWILLALRCLAILLIAATLARPRVASASFGNWFIVAVLSMVAAALIALLILCWAQQRSKLIIGLLGATAVACVIAASVMAAGTLGNDRGVVIGSQQAPVAAILVFDTSPRMNYRQANMTRLEKAQETALWLVRQLPPDSDLAVIESRPSLQGAPDDDSPTAGYARDLAAAEKAIRRLQTTGTPRNFPELLEEAQRLAAQSKRTTREIYLFTDLTVAAWQAERPLSPPAEPEGKNSGALYVIDVGATEPQNFSIRDLRLSQESLAQNSPLEIEVEVTHTGPGGARKAELLLEQADAAGPILRDGELITPPRQPRGREICDLPANGSQVVRFSLRGLPQGVHHGVVQIEGQDGLAIDDQRYFTVAVQKAWPVLVVAPEKVNTLLLTEALATFEERANQGATFDCKTVRQANLANQTLQSFAAVCLLDPQPLPPDQWQRLENYAQQGGSVAILLGHNAHPPVSFNEPEAQRILPGTLARQTRAAGRDIYLAPERYDHPILRGFRSIPRESVPWNLFPVYRHWDLDQVTEDSEVVVRYSNGKPAIVTRPIGAGRVLLATTPFTEPLSPPAWRPWNELAGESDWPRFLLVNDMLRFLVEQSGESRLNYVTGEVVTLNNDDTRHPQRYQLYPPTDQPQDAIARDGQVAVRYTEHPGAYRLKGNRGGTVLRGFAVNLPGSASDLTRLPDEALAERLGTSEFQLARNRDEIETGVRETRIGREFYPFLLVLLALVVGAEQLFSNRFYKREE